MAHDKAREMVAGRSGFGGAGLAVSQSSPAGFDVTAMVLPVARPAGLGLSADGREPSHLASEAVAEQTQRAWLVTLQR